MEILWGSIYPHTIFQGYRSMRVSSVPGFRRKELKAGMDMTDSLVIFEKDGRLARITLNRPEVLNAIDDRIPRLLQDAVERPMPMKP